MFTKNLKNREESLIPISFDEWFKYIEESNFFTWYINTPLGELHKKHKDCPLGLNVYYRIVWFNYDSKKNNFDTEINLYNDNSRITFQFPMLTKNRLKMMWEMANRLDCYLMGDKGYVTAEKYEKMLQKLNRIKRT